MTTTPSKGGPSPYKRGQKPEEDKDEQVPRTPAQKLVDDYRERVERKLEKEFGSALNAGPAGGNEGGESNIPVKTEKRVPLFIEDDVRNSLTYKFHEGALNYAPF
jgi:hypothetical protein